MRSKKTALYLNLTIVLTLLLGLVLPCILVNSANSANAATSMSSSTADWTPIYNGSYYDGINANATGASLRSQVAKLITETHTTYTTYSGLASAYKTADADPNKNGNIIWFYTGTSTSFKSFGGSGGATNREHVWPKNSGKAFPAESGPGSDAHHLRPTECNLNSTRGSKSFDEVPQTSANLVKENGRTDYPSKCYSTGTFFYPGEGYRGATARILFYMQTRWGDTYNLTFVDSAGSNKTIGKISTLMKWHLQEPPTDEEIRRNEAVYKLQGNRNPFIDHPEYAAQIYCNDGQSYNNALKQVVNTYGNYNENRPDLEGLTVSPNVINLVAGSSQTLSVTAIPSNANSKVTWSTSNSGVATVTANGLVTAVGNGSATVTATSVANPSVKATATVNVKSVTGLQLIGEPIKKIYDAGQAFDPAGLTVKLIYSDGSYVEYDSSTDLNKFTWLDEGTGQVGLTTPGGHVKCKYGNVEVISNWVITLKIPVSIEIAGSPAKTEYKEGQAFDPLGLTVKVTYNDGTDKSYSSPTELSQFRWIDASSGASLLSVTTTRIACKFGEIQAESNFTVTVTALPQNLGEFVNSVLAINDVSTLQERFTAIKTALERYDGLTAQEKAEESARTSYLTLLEEIDLYNADVAGVNAVTEKATRTGACAIVGVTTAVVALLFVLQRRFN